MPARLPWALRAADRAAAGRPHAAVPLGWSIPGQGGSLSSCIIRASPRPLALHRGPAFLCLFVRRNGLVGLPNTRRMYVGLYLAMAFLYIRNIFRVGHLCSAKREACPLFELWSSGGVAGGCVGWPAEVALLGAV